MHALVVSLKQAMIEHHKNFTLGLGHDGPSVILRTEQCICLHMGELHIRNVDKRSNSGC